MNEQTSVIFYFNGSVFIRCIVHRILGKPMLTNQQGSVLLLVLIVRITSSRLELYVGPTGG